MNQSRMHKCRLSALRSRKGNVMTLSAISLIVVLAFLAFAIDIGSLVLTRSAMQNSADAASRSAARYLPDGIDEVRRLAKKYADLNMVSDKPAPLDLKEDLEIGVWDAKNREFLRLNPGQIEDANAVRTFIIFSENRNNGLNLFIAPLLGIDSAELQATATAAIQRNIRGFRQPPKGKHHPILPFTVDLGSWELTKRGMGKDQFSFDSDSKLVGSGADGIPELNIFPAGNHAPGNRGYLNLGQDGGTNATLKRQIENGLSRQDFHVEGGLIDLGKNSSMTIDGQPGVRSTHKQAFKSIIGETRILPVFRSFKGTGSSAEYKIVRWVGVRIMHVDFGDSPKQILVQPTSVWLDKQAVISGNGDQSSNSIYTKPKLVD